MHGATPPPGVGAGSADGASVTVFQGVHDFDAIRWITGADVQRVYAVAASKALTDLGVADTVMVSLQMTDGSVAQVEQSWAVPFGVPAMLDARMEGTWERAELRSST